MDFKTVLLFSAFGSSGSYFVFTLFDNIENILIFPYDPDKVLNLAEFYSIKDYSNFENIIISKPFLFSTKKGFINKEYGLSNIGIGGTKYLEIDKNIFIQNLRQYVSINDLKNYDKLLKSIVFAYNISMGKSIQNITHLFLYMHDPIQVLKYKKYILNDYLIAISRHSNNVYLSSVKRNIAVAKEKANSEIFHNIKFLPHYKYLLKLLKFDKVLLVPIESIHFAPYTTLNKLCSKLQLTLSDELFKSTIFGLEWYGVKVTKHNGFSRTLHNSVKDIEKFGTEFLIYNTTKRFQKIVGYSLNDKAGKLNIFHGITSLKLLIVCSKDSIKLSKKVNFFKLLKNNMRLIKKIFIDIVISIQIQRIKLNEENLIVIEYVNEKYQNKVM